MKAVKHTASAKRSRAITYSTAGNFTYFIHLAYGLDKVVIFILTKVKQLQHTD